MVLAFGVRRRRGKMAAGPNRCWRRWVWRIARITSPMSLAAALVGRHRLALVNDPHILWRMNLRQFGYEIHAEIMEIFEGLTRGAPLSSSPMSRTSLPAQADSFAWMGRSRGCGKGERMDIVARRVTRGECASRHAPWPISCAPSDYAKNIIGVGAESSPWSRWGWGVRQRVTDLPASLGSNMLIIRPGAPFPADFRSSRIEDDGNKRMP